MTKPKLPSAVYSATLDDVAQRYLKHTRPVNEVELRLAQALACLEALEALVFAPRVAFRVNGENVPLAMLANALGTAGMTRLLEEDAVRFVLHRDAVFNLVKPLPGVIPIMPGKHSDSAHSDPLASSEMAIAWVLKIAPADWKRLAKLAAEKTIVTSDDSATKAIERTLAAYRSNDLASYALPHTVDVENFDEKQIQALGKVASDLFNGAVALENDFDLYEAAPTWAALTQSCKHLEMRRRTIESAEATLRLERLPSIAALILRGVITNADVVDLRQRRETIEFRKWLWSQPDPTDAAKVSEAYLASMKKPIDPKDRTFFKAARIATVGAVGAGVGALTTAVFGPAAGVLATTAAGTIAGIAVSEVDGFWIERLLTRKHPRLFATEVLSPIVAAFKPTEKQSPVMRRDGAVAGVGLDPRNAGMVQSNEPVTRKTERGVDAKRKDRNREKAKRRARKNAQRKNRR